VICFSCICCAKCRYIIECHLFKDEIITKTVFSTPNTIDNVVLNITLTKMAFQYGYVWLSRHITCVGFLVWSLPKNFKLFVFAFESFDFECYLCFHYSLAINYYWWRSVPIHHMIGPSPKSIYLMVIVMIIRQILIENIINWKKCVWLRMSYVNGIIFHFSTSYEWKRDITHRLVKWHTLVILWRH
jgi:hypothetical protein